MDANIQNQLEDGGFSRVAVLSKRLNVSTATIWRWIAAGQFPKPYKLSAGVSAFKNAEVNAWIKTRVQASSDRIAA